MQEQVNAFFLVLYSVTHETITLLVDSFLVHYSVTHGTLIVSISFTLYSATWSFCSWSRLLIKKTFDHLLYFIVTSPWISGSCVFIPLSFLRGYPGDVSLFHCHLSVDTRELCLYSIVISPWISGSHVIIFSWSSRRCGVIPFHFSRFSKWGVHLGINFLVMDVIVVKHCSTVIVLILGEMFSRWTLPQVDFRSLLLKALAD